MATIQGGTGGTFKASTAEGRLIEVACFLRNQETDSSKNPDDRNSIVGDFSINSYEFSGTYSIACSQALTTEGSVSIVASPYLQNVVFSPGTGTPTFKSTTIEAYLLEVLIYLQALEANSTKNPQGLNNVTGTYNADTAVYSGTFAIPVALAIGSSGEAGFTAVEYLQT